MRINIPGNYLPLTGGTLTGNLNLAANQLLFTDGRIKGTGTSGRLQSRNADDSALGDHTLRDLRASNVYMQSNNGVLTAPNTDTYLLKLQARDTGVGQADVAQLKGAATAYLNLVEERTRIGEVLIQQKMLIWGLIS